MFDGVDTQLRSLFVRRRRMRPRSLAARLDAIARAVAEARKALAAGGEPRRSRR